MKKTITTLSLLFCSIISNSQSFVDDFESYGLATNSAYTNTTSTPFANASASFEYKWDTGFSYWTGGFSYTNKYDSATAGFGNLYGVKPYKGYNSSNTYVIGQNNGTIKLLNQYKGVEGFYITNTTYAFKSMLLGDAFAKKFGGASGNDADYFKVVVKGYLAGSLKTDSVEFYLADYRNSNNALDYIVSSWQWVNTKPLGEIDSLTFIMRSSDVGSFGMNTPAFFGLDNFTTSPSFVGLNESIASTSIKIYPNPATEVLIIDLQEKNSVNVTITDITGKQILTENSDLGTTRLNVSTLKAGIYFVSVTSNGKTFTKKLIKN